MQRRFRWLAFCIAFVLLGLVLIRPGTASTPRVTTVPPLDSAIVVTELRLLARLETASLTYEQDVVEQVPADWAVEQALLGARDTLTLHAVGTVTAGVDLADLAPDAVQWAADGTTLVITLPPAKILGSALDEERTYPIDREESLLRFLSTADARLLETRARQRALANFAADACTRELPVVAARQARDALMPLLSTIAARQNIAAPPVIVHVTAGSCV